MLHADATLIDVAFAVCTALDRAGERALLVGGSAATFYAPEAYQSSDFDFILAFGPDAWGVVPLYVYTPTDVIRDRFMHFWAWGDYNALRVALDVAKAQRSEELRCDRFLDRS